MIVIQFWHEIQPLNHVLPPSRKKNSILALNLDTMRVQVQSQNCVFFQTEGVRLLGRVVRFYISFGPNVIQEQIYAIINGIGIRRNTPRHYGSDWVHALTCIKACVVHSLACLVVRIDFYVGFHSAQSSPIQRQPENQISLYLDNAYLNKLINKNKIFLLCLPLL